VIRPTQFEVQSELDDGTGRLTVIGELDLATAPQLQEKAQALVGRSAHEVIIDLRQMTFVDSSGLRLLIALSNRASAENWTLGLIRPAQQTFAVFEISGVDARLPFIEDP
jgi:anti-anti-sigma factor